MSARAPVSERVRACVCVSGSCERARAFSVCVLPWCRLLAAKMFMNPNLHFQLHDHTMTPTDKQGWVGRLSTFSTFFIVFQSSKFTRLSGFQLCLRSAATDQRYVKRLQVSRPDLINVRSTGQFNRNREARPKRERGSF